MQKPTTIFALFARHSECKYKTHQTPAGTGGTILGGSPLISEPLKSIKKRQNRFKIDHRGVTRIRPFPGQSQRLRESAKLEKQSQKRTHLAVLVKNTRKSDAVSTIHKQ